MGAGRRGQTVRCRSQIGGPDTGDRRRRDPLSRCNPDGSRSGRPHPASDDKRLAAAWRTSRG
jgi:hypothetical protein